MVEGLIRAGRIGGRKLEVDRFFRGVFHDLFHLEGILGV